MIIDCVCQSKGTQLRLFTLVSLSNFSVSISFLSDHSQTAGGYKYKRSSSAIFKNTKGIPMYFTETSTIVYGLANFALCSTRFQRTRVKGHERKRRTGKTIEGIESVRLVIEEVNTESRSRSR